jgi:hypothetical protein
MFQLTLCLYRRTNFAYGCNPFDVDTNVLSNRNYLENIFQGFNLVECIIDDNLPQVPRDGSMVLPANYSCNNVEEVFNFAATFCNESITEYEFRNGTFDSRLIRPYYLGISMPGEINQDWELIAGKCR